MAAHALLDRRRRGVRAVEVLHHAFALSDSVLSKHVAALEKVGCVKRRKGVHRGRRTTWISLTPRGRRALSAHVAALRALISGVD